MIKAMKIDPRDLAVGDLAVDESDSLVKVQSINGDKVVFKNEKGECIVYPDNISDVYSIAIRPEIVYQLGFSPFYNDIVPKHRLELANEYTVELSWSSFPFSESYCAAHIYRKYYTAANAQVTSINQIQALMRIAGLYDEAAAFWIQDVREVYENKEEE